MTDRPAKEVCLDTSKHRGLCTATRDAQLLQRRASPPEDGNAGRHCEGDTFYWEHLGMLSVPSYREAWDRKQQWYEDNGYLARIITSEDGADGSIDAAIIERIARKKILLEN